MSPLGGILSSLILSDSRKNNHLKIGRAWHTIHSSASFPVTRKGWTYWRFLQHEAHSVLCSKNSLQKWTHISYNTMYSTHSCTALNIKMHNHITAMACISARLFLGICASRGVTPSTRGGAAGHSTKLYIQPKFTTQICRITVHCTNYIQIPGTISRAHWPIGNTCIDFSSDSHWNLTVASSPIWSFPTLPVRVLLITLKIQFTGFRLHWNAKGQINQYCTNE